MKALVLVLSLLASGQAFAWEKIVSCDGDMLVVDRDISDAGRISYQTVFRGKLVDSMIEQKLITASDLNASGELIRESLDDSGMLWQKDRRVGFELTNTVGSTHNYSVIFSDRDGEAGDYVFHSCWLKFQKGR